MNSTEDVIRALPVFMREDARDAIERECARRSVTLSDALASALSIAWRYVDVADRGAVRALMRAEEVVRQCQKR